MTSTSCTQPTLRSTGKLHVKKHKQEGLHHTTFPLFQKWPGIKCKDASDSDRHPHTWPFSDQVGTQELPVVIFSKRIQQRPGWESQRMISALVVQSQHVYGMGGQEKKGDWIATSTHKKHQKANHGKPFDNLRKTQTSKEKNSQSKITCLWQKAVPKIKNDGRKCVWTRCSWLRITSFLPETNEKLKLPKPFLHAGDSWKLSDFQQNVPLWCHVSERQKGGPYHSPEAIAIVGIASHLPSNDANSALRVGKSAQVEPSRNDPGVLFHTCKFEKVDPKESIHQHSCSFQVADGAFDDERVCWRYIPGSLNDHKIQYGSKTGTTYSAANGSKRTPLERPRPKGAKKSRSSMAAKRLVVRL